MSLPRTLKARNRKTKLRRQTRHQSIKKPSSHKRKSQRARLTSKESCAICLEKIKTKTDKYCHNNFHESCINSWIERGKTKCPMCRSELIETPFDTAKLLEYRDRFRLVERNLYNQVYRLNRLMPGYLQTDHSFLSLSVVQKMDDCEFIDQLLDALLIEETPISNLEEEEIRILQEFDQILESIDNTTTDLAVFNLLLI